MHADLLVNLYRNEIKLGKDTINIRNQTNQQLTQHGIDLSKNAPNNLTKNLSESLYKKMNQDKNKTLGKAKQDLANLK